MGSTGGTRIEPTSGLRFAVSRIQFETLPLNGQVHTHEAIFDAMERKWVYATTGLRMTVRFCGGWDFKTKDANARPPTNVGYAKGVPMGGDSSAASTSEPSTKQ